MLFTQDHKEECLKIDDEANAVDAALRPTCYSCKINEEEMLEYVRSVSTSLLGSIKQKLALFLILYCQ